MNARAPLPLGKENPHFLGPWLSRTASHPLLAALPSSACRDLLSRDLMSLWHQGSISEPLGPACFQVPAQSIHQPPPCWALLTGSQALGPALDSLSLHQPSRPPLPGGPPSSTYGHSTSSGFPGRTILPSSPSPREGGKGPRGRGGRENC